MYVRCNTVNIATNAGGSTRTVIEFALSNRRNATAALGRASILELASGASIG